MICYAGIPANTGLSMPALKAKAQASHWAKYSRSKRATWEDRLARYDNSPSSRIEQHYIEQDEKDDCSLCLKPFNADDLVRTLGNKSHPDCTIVCQPCAERIQAEDEELLSKQDSKG